MKKTMRKLVPAICMLLISAVLLGTSTYAWFSMNRKVTVTGMTVTTKVGSNLLIAAPYDNGGTEELRENDFQSGLNQSKTGIVEPASTIDGLTYYYNTSANTAADGSAIVSDAADSYKLYNPANTADFNTNYNTTGAVAYIDYSFYLKAINAESSEQYLNMTKCNLVYQGVAITEKAWRVAVFANSTTKNTAVTDATAVAEANRITILAPESATYFSAGNAVNATNSRAAVKTSLQHGLGTAATIDTLTPGTTNYYKVVVRLWLEGEDNTCNNDTFAALTNDYRLDLAFEIEANTTNAVDELGSADNAVATATTNVGTVSLTTGNIANGEKAVSYQWYTDAATDAIIAGATDVTYTNSTNGAVSVYCLVTTDRGNVYRTNTISLGAGIVATSTNLVGSVTLTDGKLSNGKTPSSYQWYNAETGAAIDGANESTYTATSAMSVYCVVTSDEPATYRTGTLELTPAP